MTDEQIVRALEQCASEEYCSGCSMLGRASVGYECMKKVMKDAADLIKRQQAEIEEQDKAILNALKRMGEVRAEAVRKFAEFLIDKAENNVIRIGDLFDYVVEYNTLEEGK